MYSLLTDEALIKQTYHNFYNQHEKDKHFVVRLTCGHGSIEVTSRDEKYIECPQCHKHYLLTQSPLKKKLWTA